MKTGALTVRDGQKISYAVGGKEAGTPILLIHGFPFSSDMWAAQVKVLEPDFRILACDLRGTGGSQPLAGPFTMEMLVEDVYQILDQEKIARAAVMGFSMGGYLALRAIERDPRRFSALVLADTKSGADTNEAKLKRSEAIATITAKGVDAYSDTFLRSAVCPATIQRRPETVQALREMIRSGTTASGMIASLFALLSRTDTTAALPGIKVPTLILVGSEDAITPPAVAQAMREAVAGAQLAIVPESGHMSPVENPGAFNGPLLRFLKGLA